MTTDNQIINEALKQSNEPLTVRTILLSIMIWILVLVPLAFIVKTTYSSFKRKHKLRNLKLNH
jgi:hypothetical protein